MQESPEETPHRGRRRFLKALGGLGLTAGSSALIGCSSGSSNGSGGGGGTITEATRMAALQAVNTQMNVLFRAGTLDETNVLNFLRSRAEFVASGSVKPGGAWARFPDGRLLIVSFNLPPEEGRAVYTREFTTRAANAELPTSDRVRVLTALGTAFVPPHAELRLWLVKHGYSPVTGDASVESLKNVQGDGVFYINSHGDYGKLADGTDIWGLWTSDVVTEAKNATYADLLNDGSLIFFSAVHDKAFFSGDDPDNLRGTFETHYAITRRFLQRFNWQFGEDSFVFVNCCWSGDGEFGQECFNRGASVYAGWDNAVVPSGAWRAARFCFDHILGQLKDGNKEYPEPGGLQRAFDATAIKQALNQRGWQTTNSPKYGVATLAFFSNGQDPDFGLLAPSIEFMEVDEQAEKLILHGLFGSEKLPLARFVTIGTRDLQILTWTKDKIECKLPLDASGDVQARVGVRKSNARQLTEWKINLRYRFTAPGRAGLKATTTIPLRFRADIGPVRPKTGDTPTKPIRTAAATRDSAATVTASGSAIVGSCTSTWSGSEAFVIAEYRQADEPIIVTRLLINTDTKKGSLGLAYGHRGDWKLTDTTVCPGGTATNKFAASFGTMDGAVNFPDPLSRQNIPDLPLAARNITFTDQFAIAADSFDQVNTIHIEWDASPALFPPDPDAARSAKLRRA